MHRRHFAAAGNGRAKEIFLCLLGFLPCCRWTGKRTGGSVGGHAIDFVTVGSRTSAFVPALQKLLKAPAAPAATAAAICVDG